MTDCNALCDTFLYYQKRILRTQRMAASLEKVACPSDTSQCRRIQELTEKTLTTLARLEKDLLRFQKECESCRSPS